VRLNYKKNYSSCIDIFYFRKIIESLQVKLKKSINKKMGGNGKNRAGSSTSSAALLHKGIPTTSLV